MAQRHNRSPRIDRTRSRRAWGSRRARGGGWFGPAMVVLPLATFATVFLWGGPPATLARSEPAPAAPAGPAIAEPTPAAADVPQPRRTDETSAPDRERARFATCGAGPRVTCVVDGDTIWYHGQKIRIADINTPEVSSPGCPQEAQLGARATQRLTELLNLGPFTLAANTDGTGRDADRYGRLLRTVTRGGESLGNVMVAEGLAEHWQGSRRDWCRGRPST